MRFPRAVSLSLSVWSTPSASFFLCISSWIFPFLCSSSISVIPYFWSILPTKTANTSLPSYKYSMSRYFGRVGEGHFCGMPSWRRYGHVPTGACACCSCPFPVRVRASWVVWYPPDRFGRKYHFPSHIETHADILTCAGISYVALIVGQGANLMVSRSGPLVYFSPL
ncbi:uncharacterized protein EI90DRAFT_3081153, partial [Cantharellus anzutake]|uniref:uncharacterized protein n=1 Tax=Cantharellus anzutake TaxID=1750568 RepID=UPI0019034283